MKTGFDLEHLGLELSDFFEIPETATLADVKIFVEMIKDSTEKAYATCFGGAVSPDDA